jgi:hypothetical protein
MQLLTLTRASLFFLLLQMLGNILVFAKTMPSLFAPFYEDFFINASDPYQTKALKLEILTTIATEPSIPAIFEEFQVNSCSCNEQYISWVLFGTCNDVFTPSHEIYS